MFFTYLLMLACFSVAIIFFDFQSLPMHSPRSHSRHFFHFPPWCVYVSFSAGGALSAFRLPTFALSHTLIQYDQKGSVRYAKMRAGVLRRKRCGFTMVRTNIKMLCAADRAHRDERCSQTATSSIKAIAEGCRRFCKDCKRVQRPSKKGRGGVANATSKKPRVALSIKRLRIRLQIQHVNTHSVKKRFWLDFSKHLQNISNICPSCQILNFLLDTIVDI